MKPPKQRDYTIDLAQHLIQAGNLDLAVVWIKCLARAGHPPAMRLLVEYLETNDRGDEAIEWEMRLAEADDDYARIAVLTVPRDWKAGPRLRGDPVAPAAC